MTGRPALEPAAAERLRLLHAQLPATRAIARALVHRARGVLVAELRRLAATGVTYADMARALGITGQSLHEIIRTDDRYRAHEHPG